MRYYYNHIAYTTAVYNLDADKAPTKRERASFHFFLSRIFGARVPCWPSPLDPHREGAAQALGGITFRRCLRINHSEDRSCMKRNETLPMLLSCSPSTSLLNHRFQWETIVQIHNLRGESFPLTGEWTEMHIVQRKLKGIVASSVSPRTGSLQWNFTDPKIPVKTRGGIIIQVTHRVDRSMNVFLFLANSYLWRYTKKKKNER